MVRSTGIIRRVDELGRVVLPIETRRLLNISETDRLEILVDEEQGQILIQKAAKVCLKCGGTEALREVKPGWYLCGRCLAALR
ncbi:AbrB/MazE/SpoVT family DNA-binding domain-containing protein [Dysosmobacter sp.]